jgi:hypothetical protein
VLWIGGEGRGDIPSWVATHLVTELKALPETLNTLRSVQRAGFWDGKPVTFIRVYDPHAVEHAPRIEDFTTLDSNPELVRYEGYWERGSYRVFINTARPFAKPEIQRDKEKAAGR